jgi:hypothetical protein
MVGQYMDAVDAAGVSNETVFIVTSDHGDMQMEHQQHYKMVPYDASASVPSSSIVLTSACLARGMIEERVCYGTHLSSGIQPLFHLLMVPTYR